MRPAVASPYTRLALAVLCTTFALSSHAQQAAPAEEKKPGFFKRITKGVTESVSGIFKKDEPPPTPAPTPKPVEKPKSSPPTKKAAPSSTTKPKSSTSTASSTTKPKLKLTEKPSSTAPKKSSYSPGTASKEPTTKSEPSPKAKSSDISEAFGSSSKMDVPPPAPAKKAVPKESTTAATPSPAPTTAAPDKDTTPTGPTPELPASDGSWEVVKLGHDYITADSLQRFYRFSSLKVDGNHVWLRSPTIIMKATIGSQELLINNIKFILSYPTAESKGKALFSRVDLAKLIDLLDGNGGG